jgi:hypothetical protein
LKKKAVKYANQSTTVNSDQIQLDFDDLKRAESDIGLTIN